MWELVKWPQLLRLEYYILVDLGWLQLIRWYQRAWIDTKASVLVFDPRRQNGIVVKSIIVKIMIILIITLRIYKWWIQKWMKKNHTQCLNVQNKQKQGTTVRHASKRLCLARKRFRWIVKPHSENSFAPSGLQSTVFSQNQYIYFFL